ncbi:MAG: HDIG domain-containing protein [Oscillatoriales cyanobacterium]|nr:MAG: HDIG domain-containing protein [Oscillatoriales cyanobacterium]
MKASEFLPRLDREPSDRDSGAEDLGSDSAVDDPATRLEPPPRQELRSPRARVTERSSQRWRRNWLGFRRISRYWAIGRKRLTGVLCRNLEQLCCQANGQPCANRKKSPSQRLKTFLTSLVAVVVLTAAIGQPWLNQPRYGIGTIAPQDLIAPYDAQVVDQLTTRSRREAARTGIAPALKIDRTASQQVTAELQRRLERGDELRQVAGLFPYLDRRILPVDLQQTARTLDDLSWEKVLRQLGADMQPNPAAETASGRSITPQSTTPQSTTPRSVALRSITPRSTTTATKPAPVAFKSSNDAAFLAQKWVSEALFAYRSREGNAALVQVLTKIEAARDRYETARALMQDIGPQDYTVDLFLLDEATWRLTKVTTLQAIDRILIHGLPPGLQPDVIAQIVDLHVDLAVPLAGRALANQLLLRVMDRPTLVDDLDRTRMLAEQAAESVPESIVSRRAGEPIVRQGERIDAGQFALLDRYDLSYRNANWAAIWRIGGWVALAVAMFWQIERRFYQRLRLRDGLLLLLLAVSTPLLLNAAMAWPWVSPSMIANLSAVGLLAGSFYGSLIGMSLVGLLGLLLPLGTASSGSEILISAVGGLVAAAWSGRARSREELALLGGGVAIAQGGCYLITNLIASAAAESVWLAVLGVAALCGLSGLLWAIVAIGVSPYLEHLFDLVTPIRLVELANPNRPLLKRLAAEAPGTFQHTLFVASLAEAAARAVGCNVELVRAGTLYHDIGKLHRPQGFIENQMGGPNLHDQLADPWLSADIVKKHVSEGLVMARRARLPKAVQAFIPEHQGTMLIAYFYYQAKQEREEQLAQTDRALAGSQADRLTCDLDDRPIQEADFRYPGPIPQSRETGIVMLADSCEAALRSLENATYEAALTLVKRILRARLQDDQLARSGLTNDELHRIAEVFVAVWQQFNHKRIAYPKAALNMVGSAVAGSGGDRPSQRTSDACVKPPGAY